MTRPLLKFETFTASAAEVATGADRDMQRNFRKWGYLRSYSGWAQYSPQELARLLIMASCSKSGIPPATASVGASAPQAVDYLLAFAAEQPSAIDGLEFLAEQSAPFRLEKAKRYLILFGNSSVDFIFSNDPANEGLSGAFVVIDLKALGLDLARNADRPLCRIIPATEIRNKVRRRRPPAGTAGAVR